MTRIPAGLAVTLLAVVLAACADAAPSVAPASIGSAVPTAFAGYVSDPAVATPRPAPPVALPEPDPATPAANGLVGFVQSGILRLARPDGHGTVDGPAVGRVNCPSFAPVGSLLAFRRDGNLVIAALSTRGTIGAQINVRTTSAPAACPQWSPDGRATIESVARFSAAPSGIAWIVSLDGSRQRLHMPGNDWSGLVAWAYDGSSILAARQSEVLLVPLEGGEPQVVYGTETRASQDQNYYAALKSSPESAYFAVIVTCDDDSSISATRLGCLRVVGFDGTVAFQEELSEHLPPTSHSFAWSPDGTRVAWFGRDGIRVRSVDAIESQAISFEENVHGASGQVGVDSLQGLAWSPDGTRLLCEVSYTSEADGTHEHAIVSVAADGSGDVIVHSGWQTEMALLDTGDLTWQRR